MNRIYVLVLFLLATQANAWEPRESASPSDYAQFGDCTVDKICFNYILSRSDNFVIQGDQKSWGWYTIYAKLIVEGHAYRVQGYFLPDGQIRSMQFMDEDAPSDRIRLESVGNRGRNDQGPAEFITVKAYLVESSGEKLVSEFSRVLKQINPPVNSMQYRR